MSALKGIMIVCGLLACLTTQVGCSGCSEQPEQLVLGGGGEGGCDGGGLSAIKLITIEQAGAGGAGQCIDQCDCTMCCDDNTVCTEASCCQACCH